MQVSLNNESLIANESSERRKSSNEYKPTEEKWTPRWVTSCKKWQCRW